MTTPIHKALTGSSAMPSLGRAQHQSVSQEVQQALSPRPTHQQAESSVSTEFAVAPPESKAQGLATQTRPSQQRQRRNLATGLVSSSRAASEELSSHLASSPSTLGALQHRTQAQAQLPPPIPKPHPIERAVGYISEENLRQLEALDTPSPKAQQKIVPSEPYFVTPARINRFKMKD